MSYHHMMIEIVTGQRTNLLQCGCTAAELAAPEQYGKGEAITKGTVEANRDKASLSTLVLAEPEIFI